VAGQAHLTESTHQPDVFIIDDDAALREGLVELFHLEGRAAVTASTGSEALFLLEKGLEPRVILLDLNMPVMNGWDFVKAMEASPSLPGVPIVVMSGIASERHAPVREIDGGFFTKPVNIDRLLDVVNRYLGV
jgi:two-component system chemotaxis response regulator CheY